MLYCKNIMGSNLKFLWPLRKMKMKLLGIDVFSFFGRKWGKHKTTSFPNRSYKSFLSMINFFRNSILIAEMTTWVYSAVHKRKRNWLVFLFIGLSSMHRVISYVKESNTGFVNFSITLSEFIFQLTGKCFVFICVLFFSCKNCMPFSINTVHF